MANVKKKQYIVCWLRTLCKHKTFNNDFDNDNDHAKNEGYFLNLGLFSPKTVPIHLAIKLGGTPGNLGSASSTTIVTNGRVCMP